MVREHDASGRDVELFRTHLYPDGVVGPTVKGTYGCQLVDGLEPKTGETMLVKSRFSAFFATNLDLILRRLGIATVVVAGTSIQLTFSHILVQFGNFDSVLVL